MKLRELVTVLSYQMDEAQLKAAEKGFDNLKKKSQEVAALAGKAGRALTTYVTLPILAMSGIAIKAADDANDATEKLLGTYGSVGEAAIESSKKIQTAYGMSSASADKLLATTGDILQNFGLTEKQTLSLSEGIVGLSADLSSFKKVEGGIPETMRIVTSALAGQTKGLRELGIVLSQDEVKQRVATMLARGRRFETEQQATALATLSLIQERAAKASGAYMRSQRGLGETWARIKGQATNLAASFGKILLPAVEWLALKVEGLVKWLNELSPRFKVFITIAALAAATLGPLLLAIAGIVSMIGFLAGGIATLLPIIAGLNIAILPLLLKFLLIAAAILAVILIFEDLYTYFQGGESVFGHFVDKLKEWGDALSKWAAGLAADFMKWLGPILNSINAFSSFVTGSAATFSQDLSAALSFLNPGAPAVAGGGSSSTFYQQNTVRMSVDARGGSPVETTEAVRTGVESGLADAGRSAQQNFVPGRKY